MWICLRWSMDGRAICLSGSWLFYWYDSILTTRLLNILTIHQSGMISVFPGFSTPSFILLNHVMSCHVISLCFVKHAIFADANIPGHRHSLRAMVTTTARRTLATALNWISPCILCHKHKTCDGSMASPSINDRSDTDKQSSMWTSVFQRFLPTTATTLMPHDVTTSCLKDLLSTHPLCRMNVFRNLRRCQATMNPWSFEQVWVKDFTCLCYFAEVSVILSAPLRWKKNYFSTSWTNFDPFNWYKLIDFWISNLNNISEPMRWYDVIWFDVR